MSPRLDPEYKRRREAEMNEQLRQLNRKADGCRARRELAHDELPTSSRGQRAAADEDADDASIGRVALATETPIRRVNYWGDVWEEVLDMGGIRDERLPQLPMLAEHTRFQLAGVWREARVDRDRVLRAVPQFSRNQFGQDVKRDVLDGVRSTTSIGYRIWAGQLESVDEDGIERWRFTDWEPLEASWEVIPADLNAAVGRSTDSQQVAVATRSSIMALDNPTVDNAREEARKEETDRVRHVTMLGQQHNRRAEEIQKWIREGTTVDQASRVILDDARSQRRQVTTPAASMDDLVGSSRASDHPGVSEFILEGSGEIPRGRCSEISEHHKQTLGKGLSWRGGEYSIVVPNVVFQANRRLRRGSKHDRHTVDMLTRAGLDTLTQFAGQEAVFEELAGFEDMLRNKAMTFLAGAMPFPGLQGDAQFVKQTGAATAVWVAENPMADVSDSELALDLVTLKPKTLMASTFYSRQLLRQSTPMVDVLVEDDLALIHALAIDLAVLHGTGADNQPTGAYEASGVNPVSFGGTPTYAKIVEMETAIAELNGDVERMAYITTPGVRSLLRQTRLLAGSTDSVVVWSGGIRDGMMNGYPAFATNQARSDLAADGSGTTPTPLTHHAIAFGDWSTCRVGEWGALELISDPYSQKKKGLIEVASFQMIDVKFVHPEKLSKGLGLLLS